MFAIYDLEVPKIPPKKSMKFICFKIYLLLKSHKINYKNKLHLLVSSTQVFSEKVKNI